jgi:hypothetical protein
VHSPAQTSPLFQSSGSRSPALRCGCLELDHVFRPSRGPKIKWLGLRVRKLPMEAAFRCPAVEPVTARHLRREASRADCREECAAANIDSHSPSFCSTARIGDERDQHSVLRSVSRLLISARCITIRSHIAPRWHTREAALPGKTYTYWHCKDSNWDMSIVRVHQHAACITRKANYLAFASIRLWLRALMSPRPRPTMLPSGNRAVSCL